MKNKELLLLIKNQRRVKGLSQTDMAKRLNIVLKTYQNIESGITRLDIDRLMQIAQLIDLDLATVFQLNRENTIEPSNEKELYNRLITEKEYYIAKLENDIKFYQEILKENKHF
ncbi:helix-turn-helix domain-containing protein [Olivibacter domesticus]|nr:helix-turn-helix transcriptional regulator [Olivibacter domesticus]